MELVATPEVARRLDAAVAGVNGNADRLDSLLEAQNYRLAFWRASSRDLGYRRFFDIDSLVGLRIEDPEVFEATHRVILDRVAAGQIQGLRVDHPDGLRDPLGYFERLRAAAPGAWIVAEKILERDEQLPDWPIDGTTGYRFANLATGLQVDRSAEPILTDAYARLADADPSWESVAAESRHVALREQLGSDLNRLTDLFVSVCEANRRYRDFTRHELHEALRELAAAFGVYRTYVRAAQDQVAERDRLVVEQAMAIATARRPDLDPELFVFLGSILQLQVPGRLAAELAMRFQQLTPAAMAKGIEDTAFYRYLRLVALNEVGGDPGRFGVPPDGFHAAMQDELRRWPRAMLSTSTHDTKRSDDVRARLALLSEVPERWARGVERLGRAIAPHRDGDGLPGPKAEYLFFQVLVGAWPIGAERALAYMEKATREAKERTSWTSPDRAFDAALARLVAGSLADHEFVAEVEALAQPLVAPGRVNSLAQTLWKLTAPGVPDIYQGSETWDLSLVDPDNRRPVDFERRRELLDAASSRGVPAVDGDGISKVWLVQRALALRAARPRDLGPEGAYAPIAADGPAAAHVVAYRRGEGVVVVTPRLPLRLAESGGWGETVLRLPDGAWRNALASDEGPSAGERHSGRVGMGAMLDNFPVALMERVA